MSWAGRVTLAGLLAQALTASAAAAKKDMVLCRQAGRYAARSRGISLRGSQIVFTAGCCVAPCERAPQALATCVRSSGCCE